MLMYDTLATAMTPYRYHRDVSHDMVRKHGYAITFQVMHRRTNGPR